MYRPSQTPHPALSSARIASRNKLYFEAGAKRTAPGDEPESPPTDIAHSTPVETDRTRFNTRIKPLLFMKAEPPQKVKPTPLHRVSEATMKVVVFHCRISLSSHLCYTSHVTPQCRTRVKLNRVFFPR
jgi:hypothetical protein